VQTKPISISGYKSRRGCCRSDRCAWRPSGYPLCMGWERSLVVEPCMWGTWWIWCIVHLCTP